MIIGLIPRGMNLKEKTIWAARQKIILKIQFLTGDRWEIYGAASIGFFSNSANWGTWNLDSLPAYSYCSSGHILTLHTYVHLWTVICCTGDGDVLGALSLTFAPCGVVCNDVTCLAEKSPRG